jgi:hypothetical protein
MAKQASLHLSRWHRLFEGLQESSQKVYAAIEEQVQKQNIPNVKLSRVTYSEKGILSAKREYLRVRRQGRIFDICAAPFGNNFFVSWWLGENYGFIANLLMPIPYIGPFLVSKLKPETYYTLDTTLMFQDSVHSAVMTAIDAITAGKGQRVMTELEKRPIMSDVFKRKL